MVIELLRRGFAPIASVLSFIAEERLAENDQATTGLPSSANSDRLLKSGRPHTPGDGFRRHFNPNYVETDQVFDRSPVGMLV